MKRSAALALGILAVGVGIWLLTRVGSRGQLEQGGRAAVRALTPARGDARANSSPSRAKSNVRRASSRSELATVPGRARFD